MTSTEDAPAITVEEIRRYLCRLAGDNHKQRMLEAEKLERTVRRLAAAQDLDKLRSLVIRIRGD